MFDLFDGLLLTEKKKAILHITATLNDTHPTDKETDTFPFFRGYIF